MKKPLLPSSPPELNAQRPLSVTTAKPSPGSRPRRTKFWWLLLAASILLTLAVPLVLGGLTPFEMLRRLNWRVAVGLALLALTSWGFNAWRTRFLLRHLDRKISFTEAALTTIAAEFAGVTTPGAVAWPPPTLFCFITWVSPWGKPSAWGSDHGDRPGLFWHHYAPSGDPASF